MTTSQNKLAVTAPLPGPGAQLAQARMDQRWTREDVAARLHLATRQIQALEEDDYANLPGPTYVRGYLKSYALLLGLSPEAVLGAHTRQTSQPTQPQDFSTIAPQREITSHHHQIRFTTYLVAAIVLGLAVAWWVGRDTRPPRPAVVAPTAELAAPAETAPATPVTALPPGAPAATPVPATPIAPAPAAPAAKPATPAVPPAPTTAAKPAVPAPAASAATPAPLPSGPRAKLILHADQDTWVDIRDARQVKLLYETVPAGRTVTLEGVAPISVFLGNADGMRVEYNGKAVDVARHKRGVVARFTLGEGDAANAAPSP